MFSLTWKEPKPKLEPWGTVTLKEPRRVRRGERWRRVTLWSHRWERSSKQDVSSRVKRCWAPTLEVARFLLFLRASRVFKWMILIILGGYGLNILPVWIQTPRPVGCVFLPKWPTFASLRKQESRAWIECSRRYVRNVCSLRWPCSVFESIGLPLWLSWTVSIYSTNLCQPPLRSARPAGGILRH